MRKLYLSLVVSVLLLSSGCKVVDYQKAGSLAKKGDFKDAIMIYESLGDYKDSANQLAYCKSMQEMTDQFIAIQNYIEEENPKVQALIEEAQGVVNEKKPMLDDTLLPKLETSISMAKAVLKEGAELPIEEDLLKQQLDAYGVVDYSEEVSALETNLQATKESVKKFELTNNPSEAYVISCLSNVETINGIAAATEEHDPNGHLHKAGGYSAAVYFTDVSVLPNGLVGETIIDEGTSGGGCIEVFTCVEDANKRNTYLGVFDGGVFDSGSHTVVGTCIVRTSTKLTASKQADLEARIIEQLTMLK